MLKKGADPSLKDKQGKSALDLCGNNELFEILSHFQLYLENDRVSPIGEVTTYIVSEFGDCEKSPYGLDTFGANKGEHVLKASIVSPDTEKSEEGFELQPIYAWLEKFHLEDCYEMLVSAGFFNVQSLVRQMNSHMPISERNLREFGIKKPGHRRLLLIKLEEEAGLSSKIIAKTQKSSKKSCFHCCGSTQGTRNLTTYPKLHNWLEEINLGHLFDLFIDSGYDSVEMLYDIQASLHPLTSRILEQEVKITNLEQKMMILKKIQVEIGSSEENMLSFDSTQKVGCDLCNVQ